MADTPVTFTVKDDPVFSSRPYSKDPSITLHLNREGKLAKITYPTEKAPTKERLKEIISRCPLCKNINSKKLNNSNPLFKLGDRAKMTLKDIGIIYVPAHIGKLAQRGFEYIDETQGLQAAPIEQRYSTWLTVAVSILPPVLAYMGQLKGDMETAALVLGAQVSTKLQDIAEEAMVRKTPGYRSPTFRPQSQRQPAVSLPLSSTESLVPETPVAGF